MGRTGRLVTLVSVAALLCAAHQALDAQVASDSARSRPTRILFVADALSGDPLQGAVVKDWLTGNSMVTSRDGAVGLFVPAFVRRDSAIIQVTLAGYEPSERVFVEPQGDSAVVVLLNKMSEGVVPAGDRRVTRRRTDSTFVTVIVTDEARAGVSGAEIVVSGVTDGSIVRRITDTLGLEDIPIATASGQVRVVVRKVGFEPGERTLRLDDADTLSAVFTLTRFVARLGEVRATASRNRYFVNAHDIATSGRNVSDALDVIRQLRPDMFGDRLRFVPGCGGAAHVWVNGRRIVFPPDSVKLPPLPRTVSRTNRYVSIRAPDGTQRRVLVVGSRPVGERAAKDDVRKVLASIPPDHIAEMSYLDCFATTITKLFTNNAIFVVLKPGYEWDDLRGSVPSPPPPIKTP